MIFVYKYIKNKNNGKMKRRFVVYGFRKEKNGFRKHFSETLFGFCGIKFSSFKFG